MKWSSNNPKQTHSTLNETKWTFVCFTYCARAVCVWHVAWVLLKFISFHTKRHIDRNKNFSHLQFNKNALRGRFTFCDEIVCNHIVVVALVTELSVRRNMWIRTLRREETALARMKNLSKLSLIAAEHCVCARTHMNYCACISFVLVAFGRWAWRTLATHGHCIRSKIEMFISIS